MTPSDLKRLNIEHFERLLGRTTEPEERGRIERLLAEERAKGDGDYPAAAPPPASA